MAELGGWQDSDGNSPVWENIGRHFYDMDFQEADRTGALNGNQFIADLGPRYPLYAALLPKAAQDVLGRPHDDGRAAYEMLLAEGFVAGDYVDIFDGGPTVFADIDSVRTVRHAQQTTVSAIGPGGRPALVGAGAAATFRVGRGQVTPDGCIDASLAETLGLSTGDLMFVVPA